MSDQHISQEDMDALLEAMDFEIDDSPDFSVTGDVSEDGIPLICVTGRLLGTEAASLVDRVGGNLQEVDGDLFLDLMECSFFSSVALGFLFALAQQRQEKGNRLYIIEANQQICKMVGLMGMRGIVEFCSSYEDALAASRK